MSDKKKSLDRRAFIRKAAGGALAVAGTGVPCLVPATALGRGGRPAPSERIVLGCIGVGSRGGHVMRLFMREKDCQVVAVCDVKSNVLEARRQEVNRYYKNKDCKAYGDFRDLVARDDIDAVLVATCDHWHILTSLAAVRSGKDVYMEKPMGLSIDERQTIRSEVRRHKRIFQFGTQQRSDRKFRFACELVRNGKIGELRTINVWSPGSNQGGSPEPVPVPPWLDYEMWLGPAPFKPYTKDRCSNKLWWFISDYALGFIAGWGIHPMDIALWGGGEKFTGPWVVEGTGKFPTKGVCDTAMNWRVTIALGSGVKINFAGYPFPPEWKKRYGRTTSHGTAFEGTEGWVHVDRGHVNASPASLLQTKFGTSDIRLYESNNHVRNFLDCVKSRKQTVSPVDVAVRGDNLCHISDIAIRLGRKLTFDPVKERFIGDDEANKHLTRPMRAPWHL